MNQKTNSGGCPPVATSPSTPQEIHSYKLYDSAAVTLATFLGSPVAGTALMALNYRRLGKASQGTIAFLIGVAITLAVIVCGSLVPSYATTVVATALVVVTRSAFRSLQGPVVEQHYSSGGERASRWAAAGVGLVSLAIIFGGVALFVMARDPYSKIVVGSHDEIYYSGAATKHDAQALGAALQNAGYFRDRGTSVLLSKDKSGTAIGFIVKDGMWDRADLFSGFEEVVREVAPSVGGFPITLRLADSDLETKKELTVGKLVVGSKDELYYYGLATQSDASALVQSLRSSGFLQDRGVSVFLSRNGGSTTISFVLADGAWNNPTTVATFDAMVRQAAASVGGLPIKLRLVDSHLELRKEFMVNSE